MKRALILFLFCGAMASQALAQMAAPTGVPAAPPPPATAESAPAEITRPVPTVAPGTLGNMPTVVPNAQEGRELPLDAEAFDVRVHRRVTEYNQRHEQREGHTMIHRVDLGVEPRGREGHVPRCTVEKERVRWPHVARR